MPIGRSIFGKASWTALALTLCAVAVPARADTAPITAYYRDSALVGYTYPGPDKAVINVNVTATVGGVCGFAANGAPNGTVARNDIDTTGWSGQVGFTAQCSAPWRIAVSSQNGALVRTGTAAPGYQTRAPYTVKLNIPFNTGTSSGTVTDSCAVKDLNPTTTTAACSFDGAASTTNGLQVPRSFNLSGAYIEVSAPAYPGPDILVSGTYSDTLTVTVSPSV